MFQLGCLMIMLRQLRSPDLADRFRYLNSRATPEMIPVDSNSKMARTGSRCGSPAMRAISAVLFGGAPRPDCGVRRMLLVQRRNEPQWLVDLRAAAAAVRIWDSWTPYSRKARLAWLLLRWALKLRVARFVPGVALIQIPATGFGPWLADIPELQNAAPVVFIGKPSVTRKLTVFLADERGGIAAVAKLPLVPGAVESIRNEEQALRKLSGLVPGIPAALRPSFLPGVCVESWVEGKSVARRLTGEHLSLLLQLPRTGRAISMRRALDALKESPKPESRAIMDRIPVSGCWCGELQSVWEHGDFTPWNLKRSTGGVLILLDWEYSSPVGLPLLDLLHFFYRQQYLFRDMGNVRKAMDGNLLVQQYCRAFALDRETQKSLAVYYLLQSLRYEIPPLSPEDTYEAFVMEQLSSLL